MVLIVSLLVAAFLSGLCIGAIAIMVMGIQSKNLTGNPRTEVETAARRMLGVYNSALAEHQADETHIP